MKGLRIYISTFCISALILLCSMDVPKLKKVTLAKGISINLPETFTAMTEDEIASKYPSTKKPLAMYVSGDKVVDLGLNVTKSNWVGRDLNLLKDVYKSTLHTLYSEVEVIKEDIVEINKQPFIVLEFTSKADQTRNYTLLHYGVFQNRVYLFNFTCPAQNKDKWQNTAWGIMNTIKVKPGKLEEVYYNPYGTGERKGKNPQELLKEQKKNDPSKKPAPKQQAQKAGQTK